MTTFTPVKVLDHTANTDPNVHGGLMQGGKPQGCILHHTGSSGEAGDESWLSHYHANPVSINQLVRRDGTIVQIVPNNVTAWHAGDATMHGRADCNSWCMGIEICNRGDGVELYTDAQYEAVSQTVAYNTALYHIPDLNVSSHARVALPLGRKNDPKAWDWPRMWHRCDELRLNWPYDIPEWHDNGIALDPRVQSTI